MKTPPVKEKYLHKKNEFWEDINTNHKFDNESHYKYSDSNSEIIEEVKILGVHRKFAKSEIRPTKYSINQEERRKQLILNREVFDSFQRQNALRSKLLDKDHAVRL